MSESENSIKKISKERQRQAVIAVTKRRRRQRRKAKIASGNYWSFYAIME